MATPIDPAVQYAQELSYLRNSLASLQTKVQMADTRDEIEDLNTKITGLPQTIKNLRDRKYVFDKGLAERASELGVRWVANYPGINRYIDQQADELAIAIRPLETQVGYIATQANNPAYGLSMIQSLKANMETIESKASSASTTATGMYDEIRDLFTAIQKQVDKIDWMLDRMNEASFQFLPTEAGIMAVKANWSRDGREDKDDPQGILFLTDQRLIFEQNQEVATKKVLFITTERKKVQQKLLEVSIYLVEEIKASKQGIFNNEDFIDLRLAHGAPAPAAQFHIFGHDSSDWQGLVNNARAHEFDNDRVIVIDQSVLDKVKAAPTICPACGGALTKPVMRGMDTLTCDFCGNIIRL